MFTAARSDCESTIAAVGSVFRPSFSRTRSRSRLWNSASSPVICQRRAKACTRRYGGKSAGKLAHFTPLSTM
jgi:hypothetical protein